MSRKAPDLTGRIGRYPDSAKGLPLTDQRSPASHLRCPACHEWLDLCDCQAGAA